MLIYLDIKTWIKALAQMRDTNLFLIRYKPGLKPWAPQCLSWDVHIVLIFDNEGISSFMLTAKEYFKPRLW